MHSDMTFNLMGGLGMILLGMKLMTDGLKVAGGGALRRVLGASTKTPLRGLASGFVMTSLVQSSSAITVAAIGFVNAGLMSLAGVVWVVYGSNIGTTTTAWIVAAVGLKIKIKALALPFIALGTALWLTGRNTRRSALGEAVSGFGVFFFGVEILQLAFEGMEQLPMALFMQTGVMGQVVFVGIGFFLTLVMQSSSASMALILTATAGGLASMEMAAAAVIGANLGTTSTAVLASIGATPNAKRVAFVHVVFNIITGLAAFGLLVPLLRLIDYLREQLMIGQDMAETLALFHTMFNLLGVMLLAPLTGLLIRFVKGRFRTAEEDEAQVKYLDDNVMEAPALAINALLMELGRIGQVARRMASSALSGKRNGNVAQDRAILESLQLSVAEFAHRLGSREMSRESAQILPRLVRVSQYYNAVAGLVSEAEAIRQGLDRLPKEEFRQRMDDLMGMAGAVVNNSNPEKGSFSRTRLDLFLDDFERQYKELKDRILSGVIVGDLATSAMVGYLERLSRIRRMTEQLVKAAQLHQALKRERTLLVAEADNGLNKENATSDTP